jgi:hypothetical protein
MPVKDTDRAEFEAFHDLGFDSDGREILVGLSYEETEWYLDVLERERTGRHLVTKEEVLRRTYLDDRHAAVRLQITQAIEEARFNALLERGSPLAKRPKPMKMHPGAVAMARKSRARNESF